MTPKQALKFLIKEHVKQLLEGIPTIRGADGKLRNPANEAEWAQVRAANKKAMEERVPGTWETDAEKNARAEEESNRFQKTMASIASKRQGVGHGSEEREPPTAAKIVSKPTPSKDEKDKQDAQRREEQRAWDEENGLNGYGSVGGNMRSAAARV